MTVTAQSQNSNPDSNQNALDFAHAFRECSDEVQRVVLDMFEIVGDSNSDEDEVQMALATIADALSLNPHKGRYGMGLLESEAEAAECNDELKATIVQMDAEEESFSDRLEAEMNRLGMTQAELAQKIGIGQPAISNIINRDSRPQRKTVEKIAAALNLPPADLWASF